MSILFRKRPRPYSDDREDELPRLSARDEDDDDFPTLGDEEDDDIPVLTPGTHHKLGRQPVPSVQPAHQAPPAPPVRNPEPAPQYDEPEPEPSPIAPGASHVRPGGLFASEPGPEAAMQSGRPEQPATSPAWNQRPVQTARPPIQRRQQPQPRQIPSQQHQPSHPQQQSVCDSAWLHGSAASQAAPHSSGPSSQELSRIIDRIVNFELEQAHERIRLRLMNELGDILKD